MTKEERKLVAEYIRTVPMKPYRVIAAETGLSRDTIQRCAKEFGIRRPVGKKVTFTIPEAVL